MNTHELRIGNYLKDELTGAILWVSELIKEYGSDDSKMVTYVINRSLFPLPDGWKQSPIQLTPELLEKCGFLIDAYSTASIGDYVLVPVGNGYEFEGRTVIKHLHMLQNHYYFSEGSELPVNMEV